MIALVLGLDTAANRLHGILLDADASVISRPAVKVADTNPDVRRSALYYGAVNEFDHCVGIAQRRGAELHIFCEEPLALKNGKTTRLLSLAAGAIWAAHLGFSVFWHWVDVATWKKTVIGNGNASKEMIREFLIEHHGAPEDWDEDHYDALALALYGREYLTQVA